MRENAEIVKSYNSQNSDYINAQIERFEMMMEMSPEKAQAYFNKQTLNV
jgi:hypothetical protein